MSILTFNASTADRKLMSEINGPFQIMPGGRGVLSNSVADSFPDINNPGVIIHISYITRPFTDEPSAVTKTNMHNYTVVCKHLGTKNILIHMPSNVSEYENYDIGLEFIIEHVCKKGLICHLETNPLTMEFRRYYDINDENMVEKYIEYTDELLAQIPKKYKSSFKIVVDTAHLFANGFHTDDMIRYMDRYKSYIEYIHLNGSMASFANSKDRHIPMYKPKNKIDEVDKLMTYVAKMNVVLIAEDSTEKGSYDEWHEFCDKFGIKLIEFNKSLSI